MTEKAVTEKVDFSKSEQYTLSIRLSTDGFSFSIYNPIHDNEFYFVPKEIKPSVSLAANVKEIFKESEFLNHPYKRENVLYISKRFTLIPFELYEDDDIESIFYQNHPKQENEIVLCNILKKSGIALVYAVDKSVYQQITEIFPTATFSSQAGVLIEHFVGKSRLGNSRKMYVYIRENAIELYCYNRGKLLLANTFPCKETADRVYYMLYVWKQLNFDQERDELHLCGLLNNKEELMEELRRYLGQVFIINTKIEEIPFDLQILSLPE